MATTTKHRHDAVYPQRLRVDRRGDAREADADGTIGEEVPAVSTSSLELAAEDTTEEYQPSPPPSSLP